MYLDAYTFLAGAINSDNSVSSMTIATAASESLLMGNALDLGYTPSTSGTGMPDEVTLLDANYASNSSNVDYNASTFPRDIGEGQPLYMIVTIPTVAAQAQNGTIDFQLYYSSSATSLSTSTMVGTTGPKTIIYAGSAYTGDIIPGKMYALPIRPLIGGTGYRYLVGQVVIAYTSGTIGCGVVASIGPQVQDGKKFYPSAITVY